MSGRELFLNNFLESCFLLCAAQENPIDEKAGRATDSGAHPFLGVLLNLSLVFLAGEAGVELFFVQLELGSFALETVRVKASLVAKKQIMILPELTLLQGAARRLRRSHRHGMNLRYGHVAKRQRHGALMHR